MFSTYIKQTIQLIKANKVMSIISIVGTALSITMIMVMVLIYQIQTANFMPEINRDRTLYIEYMFYQFNEGNRTFGGPISERTAKECFGTLQSAKAIITTDLVEAYLTTEDEQQQMKGHYRGVDPNYWELYSYRFVEGRAFSPEEFQSGVKKAVITMEVAQTCFGGAKEALGSVIQINFVNYEVCGVVENVSSLLNFSYSNTWIPYTSEKRNPWNGCEDTMGSFKVLLLMNTTIDFEQIKAEMEESMKRFNATLTNGKVSYQEGPFNHLLFSIGKGLFSTSEMKEMMIRLVAVLLILLLVPAINLSSFTVSRMRKRLSEIGIRKAYGAVRSDIIGQVIYENLLLTLIGGILGVVISYLIIHNIVDTFIGGDMFQDVGEHSFLSANMIFRPIVLLYAFLFCLVLNLMSAFIPAWRVSKTTIINAIKY